MLELLDETQMRALIGYKPKTYRETRLHVAVLLVMDTGLRISEALGLREREIPPSKYSARGYRIGTLRSNAEPRCADVPNAMRSAATEGSGYSA